MQLNEWAKEFGNLYSLNLGTSSAIVVTDAKILRELLNLPTSTGKFSTDTILLISQGPYGVVSSEGKPWQEQRHFSVKNLKRFGIGGGPEQESTLLFQADTVCEWIAKEMNINQGLVSVHKILSTVTNNTLWHMISGENFDISDSKIAKLMEHYLQSIQYTMKTGLGFFSWLKHFAPELSGYNNFDMICKQLHAFVKDSFESHRKTMDWDQPPRDLIDAYIHELEDKSNLNRYESFQGSVGIKNAVASVVELFLAGSETTAVTLNWLIFYLAQNPDIQKKLHAEIESVIGNDCEPSLLHKSRYHRNSKTLCQIYLSMFLTHICILCMMANA